ncbi:hypothetical protein AGABI1DRAFT_94489 [Agaricus bisporus var. burnettii JB137-S8]|uniref:Uncharacterized protein n=1 Tax=Agaricus bisporus var. burnettii (strain JB137-S8 / ATCC MYA-4627 / FGSC 10392) TaxID=597362 RepID=K5WYX7_AGABU|nr:uncharacterized protein AGABI1DRAFT_94489 [Agaricus bisporus var. burnettii JB137-S8]EKM76033.1 hypothetical protein AGABI1DRAFT_94489 [Agaricus bisporus var. burnettii JB137-S8]
MNKTSLVNLAQRLALQPDGTVIALRERIREHLAQNPDALRATQLDRLLPNRGHRGRPRGNRQPSPRPITPEPADDASGNRTDSDSEMDVESSPSWRGIPRTPPRNVRTTSDLLPEEPTPEDTKTRTDTIGILS